MDVTYAIAAGDFSHAGFASSEVKHLLKRLNVPSKIIKRVVIALYEAEVNITAHSFGGSVSCTIIPEKITINAKDTGPGIPDIDLAMSEGFSTASQEVREMGFGAGMGLPNMQNNSDELSISSSEEGGTEIIMTINFEGELPE